MAQTIIKNTELTAKGNPLVLIKNDDCVSVLVAGCVHGDEPQGEFLISEYLKTHRSTRLMFIPSLNPDGVCAKTRVNSNGVDINRNFPSENWELTERGDFFGGVRPASEIETRFLIKIIEELKPKLILALHAPYKVVNYDGDALEIAEIISDITGYSVEASIGYPTPGSLGSWAGIEKKIPVITLELDEEIPVEELKKPVFEVFEMLENYDKIVNVSMERAVDI